MNTTQSEKMDSFHAKQRQILEDLINGDRFIYTKEINEEEGRAFKSLLQENYIYQSRKHQYELTNEGLLIATLLRDSLILKTTQTTVVKRINILLNQLKLWKAHFIKWLNFPDFIRNVIIGIVIIIIALFFGLSV